MRWLLIFNEYYNNYDEDNRLIKDNTHKLEFITTTKYLEKFLKPNVKILEIGAGTGGYSLHYANLGYDVTAIEYVKHNLDILKSKITKDMNINALEGDALDLSRFSDNTFDITLVLGPLYHLYDDSDIKKAISEAIRVTKVDGIIAIAYLTSDGVFMHWVLDGHLIDGYPNDFGDDFKLKRYPEGIFAPFDILEFKEIMKQYKVKLLYNISTDGVAELVSEKLNKLTEEEFQVFVKYHLSRCERLDLQGFSCHMLYICQKRG